MNTFLLACRNLTRNRRRSLATLIAMSIGLTAVLVFGGYATNIILSLQTAVIKRSGHLQIMRHGYYLDGASNPEGYGIADYERLVKAVSADPELGAMLNVVTPMLEFGAIAGNFTAGASRSVLAHGVVAAERNRMFAWNAYNVPDYADPLKLEGTPMDAAIVGEGVARRLQLCEALRISGCQTSQASQAPPSAPADAAPQSVLDLSAMEGAGARAADGGRIELLAANARGAPNVVSLNVISATNVGIKEWDDVYFTLHLGQAQRLLFGKAEPMVTSILVQLRHTEQLPRARARLETIVRDLGLSASLEVMDYEALNPLYGQSLRFMMSVFMFIAALIATIVVFTVGNTMSMAVTERTVEIGTLRAIGMRRSGIRGIFVAEGIVLGIVGALVGTLTAFVTAFIINHSGLTWTPPGHIASYLIQIDILLNRALLAGSAACLVLVAALAAWLPAARAAKLKLVEALHHV